MNRNNSKCVNGRRVKKGITVAFLGIDGTGKSTHAEKISSWFQEHEIQCIVIPFHKWMFADILKKRIGKYVDSGRKSNTLKPYTPRKYSLPALLKPPVALLDNILMFYFSKWKFKEYDVIIFDRFVCATLIKSKALNYHVDWLRPVWQNVKIDIGLVLDAPIQKSLDSIDYRGNHILYSPEQLAREREEYLEMARKYGYAVFDTSKPLESVHEDIKTYLSRIVFPTV